MKHQKVGLINTEAIEGSTEVAALFQEKGALQYLDIAIV